mmetsp:Transcript_10660/g.27995  ORF Transcript_10660/g.27995 Transcript_10660/m.27995 type:complete len:526 (-) Transcript_10660:240-1817(-)
MQGFPSRPRKPGIVLVGLQSAGKTSLLNLIRDGRPCASPEPTLNPSKELFRISSASDNRRGKKTPAYDLGGDTMNRHMWPLYAQQALVLIYVVDVTAAPDALFEARDELHRLYVGDAFLEAGTVGPNVPLIVLANKVDKLGGPSVQVEEAVANLLGLGSLGCAREPLVMSVSAVTGEGMFEAIEHIKEEIRAAKESKHTARHSKRSAAGDLVGAPSFIGDSFFVLGSEGSEHAGKSDEALERTNSIPRFFSPGPEAERGVARTSDAGGEGEGEKKPAQIKTIPVPRAARVRILADLKQSMDKVNKSMSRNMSRNASMKPRGPPVDLTASPREEHGVPRSVPPKDLLGPVETSSTFGVPVMAMEIDPTHGLKMPKEYRDSPLMKRRVKREQSAGPRVRANPLKGSPTAEYGSPSPLRSDNKLGAITPLNMDIDIERAASPQVGGLAGATNSGRLVESPIKSPKKNKGAITGKKIAAALRKVSSRNGLSEVLSSSPLARFEPRKSTTPSVMTETVIKPVARKAPGAP